jgi:diamine N-acetyltransferase
MKNLPDESQALHFREITAETVRRIIKLSDTLTPEQRRMVADNAVSIAEAHFCDKAWFRAIYAGDEPVGFIMLHLGGESEDPSDYNGVYLWRFMIAGPHQGKGYGRQALEMIKRWLEERGDSELMTSYVPVEGGPGPFYAKMGFVATGNVHEGEVETLLRWTVENGGGP